jgi:hypothetical protein
LSSGVNFFFFHLMPWPYLPPPREFLREHEAAWVTLSNSLYDPVRGVDLYERYVDELADAEELGFDGVVVNEHHQNAYGMMPSPNLIAAALSQRTERIRICVLGNALPLWNPPLRLASLDVLLTARTATARVVYTSRWSAGKSGRHKHESIHARRSRWTTTPKPPWCRAAGAAFLPG